MNLDHPHGTAYWKRRRLLQLKAEPLCRMCLRNGIVRTATIADHIEPHHNDWNKFKLGELQSLCEQCHNQTKRMIELQGYGLEVDDDGWPIDPNHPANRI
ncbi:MAG TPA: HNH endonuclease [Xanthobacteraceae bacterium]|jgi:5-methylcytosine-specific restriction endonuclease McrA